MADRSVGLGDSLNSLRLRHNATASDIGEIATLTGTSGIVASATDVVEGVTLLNTDLNAIPTDAHIFSGASLVFEGATDDSYETTLTVTDPTADRTFTFPDANGDVVLITATQTMSNKTLTTPTINAGTFSGSFTGTMDITGTVLSGASPLVFEGATADDYETTLAFTDPTADRVLTVPNATDTLVGKATTDTLSNKSYDLGGTGNTATGTVAEFNSALQGDSFVTLTGSETLTNKTLTSPTINAGTFSGTFTGTMDVTGTVLSGASPLVFEGATDDGYETTLAFTDPTADRVITIPNATDTLTGKATTDTLTNKSIDLENNTLTGSLAEFNTALQSVSFTSLTGSETLTNKTFTSPTINEWTFASGNTMSGLTTESSIIFEGATADAYETTLSVADPTADRVITIPNSTMTCVTTATHASKGTHISRCIALG